MGHTDCRSHPHIAVYTFGNSDLKARVLPDSLSGHYDWAQGFSEPGAGSDLTALRTRAVRDGNDYVVDGSKLWTTDAEISAPHEPLAPFGGFKRSGIGREYGAFGLDGFLEPRAVLR